MQSRTRVLVAGPILVAAALLAAVSVRDGIADSAVYAASAEVGAWSASGSAPGEQTRQWIAEDLDHALALVGSDPSSHELRGIVAALNHGDPESMKLARAEFIRAVDLRPTSPYTWLHLAALDYQAGDTGASFERQLRRAAELGPSEPWVQREGAFLGLAVYDEISAPTRAQVDRLIAAGARRDVLEMMQISMRRGRLDVTCGLVRGTAAPIDPKTSQLCQSMGASS